VNPIDWKIREGYMKKWIPAKFPLTMGQDFAGEVVEVGQRVEAFHQGQRVFGFAHGTYAESAVAAASMVAEMPESMSFEVAAALPTAGSTALQLIRGVVDAHRGMSILIHGAAGGVGSFATQIAKDRGARIIATATGPRDIAYLQSLGVDQIIDFKRERFEDKVHEVDAVVDLVGGETRARSYRIIKKGGVLATTVEPIDENAAKQAGIRAVQVLMQRNAADLIDLAHQVVKGVLKPRMGKNLPLNEARQAQEMSQKGQAGGKLILKVA
jgi:NADPH:quinone reductase-like Zn-dependent oxidoreductase